VKSENKKHDGKVLGPKDSNISGYIYEKLINSDFVVSSSVVVKKSVIDKVGNFDESIELRPAEDFDLWLRVTNESKAVFLSEIQGIYRIHSFNFNVKDQRLKRALKVIEKQERLGLATKNQANRAKANHYFREGWFALGKNVKVARYYFAKAIRRNGKNAKILIVSSIGILLSFVPFFYRFIRKRNIDKKLSAFLLNSQNL